MNEANRLRAASDLDSTLLDIISRKSLTKSTTLSFHLLHPTDVRFASYLYSITHDENGNCVQKKIASKDLKEIAGCINTTVRHQNRILHSFQKEGIIERIRGGLLLKSPSQLKDKTKDNLYEIHIRF
ncbi:helix-turn-helix domain-containing protein [Terribacillus sp. 179-K 1B1 HS]|uniref:helix-turn-helix domain-containing protein n=1 Tax=Terribacillus sp. 179-K 1B1 HS TaxID=3142388 RepID=UPI0039A1B04A